MKLVIQGKNIEITDAINEYVTQKIEKAVNHFQHLMTEVDVSLSVARNPRITSSQTAEVTLYLNGAVIRAEESSENLYASIDLVADKITRKLRKYKEKRQEKQHTAISKSAEALADRPLVEDLVRDREPQLPTQVLRTKYFAMPPMSVQEALEQLELIDHDFYMFLNSETNEINVVYERNHGGYGLLQPRFVNNHKNGNGKSHHENGTSKSSHESVADSALKEH